MKTAVEWLVDQMLKQGYFDANKKLTFTNLDNLEHQALKMEKEQMKEMYLKGIKNYDPTFKKMYLKIITNEF